MSETPPVSVSKPSEWRSPQVILPIIATISTVIVAMIGVLPAILEANKPQVTPTPMVILIATPVPTLAAQAVVPTNAPSDTPVPTAMPSPTVEPTIALTTMSGPTVTPMFTETYTLTPISTEMPTSAAQEAAPPAQPTLTPNIILFYDNDSFTVWNNSGYSVGMVDVTMRSGSTSWEMSQWGSLVKPLPNDKCLRLRDALIGERTPPTECTGKIHGFFKVGHAAIFWRNVTQFEVLKNGSVIATCDATAGKCPIYVPQ